ncbi:MAG TPA: hypothetical protein VMY36_01400 [Patescibacteria group bacterium]|nr:hypothetical protein [Patescibacteria group bacterium]
MKLIKSIKKWLRQNKGLLFFILSVFIIWQVLLSGLIALGERFFPTMTEYLYTGRVALDPQWLCCRANFEGIDYLDIAKKGYGIYQQAFFPLYPKLIEFIGFSPIFRGRLLLAGLFISSISLFFSLFLFFKLVRLDFNRRIARRAILYLLIFPTSFYLAAVYTESLFLVLILASFYFAKTKNWWLAGIFGLLAASTRLTGVFLFPALVVELAFQSGFDQKEKRDLKYFTSNLMPLLFIPLGLIGYMSYLRINFLDPLLFARVQPYFGAGRETSKLVLLYQVFWRYLKMLITVDKTSPVYLTVILEFLSGTLFFFLIVFTYLRRWFAYFTFMALAYLLPTLTGTFCSMPRYVLVLFPGFILLSIWAEKYRWVRILYPIIVIPLLIMAVLFFTRGFWLA